MHVGILYVGSYETTMHDHITMHHTILMLGYIMLHLPTRHTSYLGTALWFQLTLLLLGCLIDDQGHCSHNPLVGFICLLG